MLKLSTIKKQKTNIGFLFFCFFECFTADVLSYTDYYPFGMPMPGRQLIAASGKYRYGFQNQETDPEMLGGAVAFKYRVHDARIGRFLSVDPLSPEYPWNSSYAFSENRVNDAIELEGLESFSIHEKRDASGNITLFVKLDATDVEFQVYDKRTKETTYRFFPEVAMQKKLGNAEVTGDGALIANNRVYRKAPSTPPGSKSPPEFGEFFPPSARTPSKQETTIRANTPSANRMAGNFGSEGRSVSRTYNTGESSIDANVRFTFNDGGSIPNSFNVLGPDGNSLLPSGPVGAGGLTITIPSNTQFTVTVNGEQGNSLDSYGVDVSIQTFSSEQRTVIDDD